MPKVSEPIEVTCSTIRRGVDIPFRGDSKPCDFKGEGAGEVSV